SFVLSGIRWFEEHVQQSVLEPLLVARRGPSPSRDQLVVEVGARHGPDAAESVRGRNSPSQLSLRQHRLQLRLYLLESESFDLLIFGQEVGVAGFAHEAHDRRETFVEAAGDPHTNENLALQMA